MAARIPGPKPARPDASCPDGIAADLAGRLAHHVPHTLPDPIPRNASLTQHLGLGSIELMAFLADVRQSHGVELGEWLVQQAAGGRDTLGTLADHVASLHDERGRLRRVGRAGHRDA